MLLFRGAHLVLPDRILGPATLAVDGDTIAEISSDVAPPAGAHETYDLDGRFVLPGFIDVHVHGVEAHDTQDPSVPIEAIARRLPAYGVTAFCPTTVACAPGELDAVLREIARLRANPPDAAARVLPAHLESNFIAPDYRGAQPIACLRLPPAADDGTGDARGLADEASDFTGADIVAVIASRRAQVGIVTLAPELEGAEALIADLVAHGHRVSLGHSGASYEAAVTGIRAGARHATHLFNRMPPLHHREPGLAGAVLHHPELAAEIVCDGYHVHPAMVANAVAAKTPARAMAITDGTGGSGLPVGSHASLGGRRITVRETAAFLDDGTLAGSTLTMDRALRFLVGRVGLSLVDGVRMCATTPASELGLSRQGRLAEGALADFVVVDADLRVEQTWIGGRRVFGAGRG
jgi:N-acetylglucosamine-6-phosphate deacetylase